jgi:uncharacterized membrane protein HdeD (DUF308 family)
MSTFATPPRASEHAATWKWFLALGVVLFVLGLAGVTTASVLETASVLVFGPLLLASSFVQCLIAFFAEKGKECRLHFAAAGLEAVLGFYLMANPFQEVLGLVAVVGVFLVVGGLVRLARALVTETHRRGWVMLAAVVSLVLGVSLWTGWPDRRLWFAGLCIAIDFLFHGVTWSALALGERNRERERVA